MTKPVVLWSTPRSVSTAFDKMMRCRGDHQVFTEPFSVPYYFGPDRCSDRYASHDEAVSATYEQTWAAIDAASNLGPTFAKAMPHHLGPHLGADAVARFTNSFLIRDPAWSVPSCLALWPDATDEELGYEAQHRAFELAREGSDDVPVIDAVDLRSDPAAVVRAWCDAVRIEPRAEWLTWPPGMPADWELWVEWFRRAASSSCFAPPDGRLAPSVDDAVVDRIDRCRTYYDELRAHRIR